MRSSVWQLETGVYQKGLGWRGGRAVGDMKKWGGWGRQKRRPAGGKTL